MKFLAIVIGLLVATSGAASADPVSGAILAASNWFALQTAFVQFAIRIAVSVALSALSRALQKQPEQAGLRTETTLAGEDTPGSLIFGKYATAGFMACPPMSQGHSGDTANAYLTYVIELGDAPYTSLDAVWIGDDKVPLTRADGTGNYPDHMQPAPDTRYRGNFWIKFFDGTQTTAYAGLIGTGGDRPWTADMIGRGIPYAVCRFRYDREVYSGFPQMLFEVSGVRLYDPRKDSTAGGSGTQRWGQTNTYAFSENPAVQVYNVLRGITLQDGSRWGGDVGANDLPLSNWFAAMNECDVTVDGQPQYRSSFEVRIGPDYMGGDEPARVIEEILRGCSGQITEYGGVYKLRIGGPGLPVAAFTDDDIIITQDQQFEPFPSLDQTYNGVQCQYPEPLERWASKEAPPRYNGPYEVSDGRRMVASLRLPATPYAAQVQRVMRAYIEEERRFRRHVLSLPPDFARLEPLDAVTWASERNGYTAKVFEVTSQDDDLRTLVQRFGLRERDPNDYNWTPGYVLPTTINDPGTVVPAPRQVLGFGVQPVAVKDGFGTPRRPGLRLYWNGDQPDARGLQWQIRPQGQADLAAQGSTQDVATGYLIVTEGLIGATAYECRARLVIDGRRTEWTGWIVATTPDVRLGYNDLAPEIIADVDALETWADGTGPFLRDLRAEIAAIRDSAAEIDFSAYTQREVVRVEYKAEVAGAQAYFNDQITLLAGEDAALASRITVLGVEVGDNAASITQEQLARADAVSALAADITTVEASIPGAIATATAALVGRVEDTEAGLVAQTDAITLVEAKTDRSSANGLLRISSEATPVGSQTRIGIRAEASANGATHSAAMFLEAKSDGTSQMLVNASRFAIVSSNAVDASKVVPFYVDGGVVYMDVARIKDLSVDTLKLQSGSITDLYSTSFGALSTGSETYATLATLNFTPFGNTSRIIVGGFIDSYYEFVDGGGNFCYFRVLLNGTSIASYRLDAADGHPIGGAAARTERELTVLEFRNAINGVNTVQLQARVSYAANFVTANTVSGRLYVQEFKR